MRITATVLGMVLFAFVSVALGQGTIDIAPQWAFCPDGKNVGISEGWQTSTYDDSAWAKIDAGRQWEALGYPDLDGYAW
nr:hypothetical protein [bacterium]